MKNKKVLCIMMAACLACAGAAGCGQNSEKKTDGQKGKQEETFKDERDSDAKGSRAREELVVEGTYMPYGDGEYVFVDTKSESLFIAKIPEGELYDENDKKIKLQDLKKGDLITCYGAEIIQESYPPRYPAIEKMVRTKEGNGQVPDSYMQLLDEFYRAPSDSDIPYMDIENVQKDALVTSAATQCGYNWTYKDENGEEKTQGRTAAHVLEMDNLIDLNCNGDNSDLTLFFSRKPDSVKVQRWPLGTKVNDDIAGEPVEVTMDEKGALIKNAEKTSVYEVTAEWKNGSVTYGFYIK